ncbi:MAG: hypothetical protein GY858_00540 [Candidatus Omnitrophica bacterium]|nr:hypothetical protein [Candidatus Omnitrophota bacterium]
MKKQIIGLWKEIAIIAFATFFLDIIFSKFSFNGVLFMLLASFSTSLMGGYLIMKKGASRRCSLIIPPVVFVVTFLLFRANSFLVLFTTDGLNFAAELANSDNPHLAYLPPIILKLMAAGGAIFATTIFSLPTAFLGSWRGIELCKYLIKSKSQLPEVDSLPKQASQPGNMSKYSGLIDLLKERLRPHKYTEYDMVPFSDSQEIAVIKTLRKGTISHVCAVVELSTDDFSQTKRVVEQIRDKLTCTYARFPWWKDLGSFLVLICPNDLFHKIKNKTREFADSHGLHMNVILGACLINKDTFDNTAKSTWGLVFSGKYYEVIRKAVVEWCEKKT